MPYNRVQSGATGDRDMGPGARVVMGPVAPIPFSPEVAHLHRPVVPRSTVVFAAVSADCRLTRSFTGRVYAGAPRRGGPSPLSTSISQEAL